MEVICFLQSPATGLSSPLCAYLVPTPFQSQHIIDLFPFEGCNFYFRIKLSSSALGIPNPSNDFVWLDIVPDLDRWMDWKKLAQYFPDNKIEVKVVADGVDFDDELEGPDGENYVAHLNESMLFVPPQVRQQREAISPKVVGTAPISSSSRGHSSFLGGFGSKNKSDSTSGPRDDSRENGSKDPSAANPAGINLKTVQKGATNLWKALKSTTEKLQGPAFSLFNAEQDSHISKKAQANLATLSQLFSTPYQDQNPQHGYIISKLWETTFPNELPPATSSGNELIASSPLWKTAGWQKDHPSHDLKISGLLALNALAYFGEVYREISQEMILANRSNTKQNYPYAIVGVNLTLLLADLFSLRDNEYVRVDDSFFLVPLCLRDLMSIDTTTSLPTIGASSMSPRPSMR